MLIDDELTIDGALAAAAKHGRLALTGDSPPRRPHPTAAGLGSTPSPAGARERFLTKASQVLTGLAVAAGLAALAGFVALVIFGLEYGSLSEQEVDAAFGEDELELTLAAAAVLGGLIIGAVLGLGGSLAAGRADALKDARISAWQDGILPAARFRVRAAPTADGDIRLDLVGLFPKKDYFGLFTTYSEVIARTTMLNTGLDEDVSGHWKAIASELTDLAATRATEAAAEQAAVLDVRRRAAEHASALNA
jgi:hypothetical protein